MLLQSPPTLRGTPTALLRAATAQELQQRLACLESEYPRTYRPQNYLDRRFFQTAKNEMARIKRELSTRCDVRLDGMANEKRPLSEWPRVQTGDRVEHDFYGECEVIRVQWDPNTTQGLINLRLADGKLKAVHPSTIVRIIEKGTPDDPRLV
jgi:hypothetical protein